MNNSLGLDSAYLLDSDLSSVQHHPPLNNLDLKIVILYKAEPLSSVT